MGVIKKKVIIRDHEGSDSPDDSGEDQLRLTIPSPDYIPIIEDDFRRRHRHRRSSTSSSGFPPRLPSSKGHKLTLKRGRRSRRRYDNERDLLDQARGGDDYDYADEEDDFRNASSANFTELLDHEDLWYRFVSDDRGLITEDTSSSSSSGKSGKKNGIKESAEFDPESAFLGISGSLRFALKKHLPQGMLEGLESEIREFFKAHPTSEYVSEELSSFERLLAHACSTYNWLTSRSYDGANGKRRLVIVNPRSYFQAPDPSLAHYLQIRSPRSPNTSVK